MTSSTDSQAGLTLIQTMVGVVIIGILLAVLVPRLVHRYEEKKVTETQQSLTTLSKSLDTYYSEHGAYPNTTQGLAALSVSASTTPDTTDKQPALLLDGWGHAFQYRQPGTDRAYDLFSLGADGKVGGEGFDADIYQKSLEMNH